MFKNMDEFKKLLSKKWSELDAVHNYLSDAGLAAKEAYAGISWHAEFHKNLAELRDDPNLRALLEVEGKHPEYYRVLTMVIKSLRNF